MQELAALHEANAQGEGGTGVTGTDG